MRPMQFIAMVAQFAAAVSSSSEEPDHEIQIFKRGDPLTPEDLVLASKHGVNTTEMFKHSVVKRRGEEAVTIWVDHSFDEQSPHENPSIAKRGLNIINDKYYSDPVHSQWCTRISHRGDTGPNAPCTGGLKEIRSWARQNPGIFKAYGPANTNWRTLVAAGSNTDCNGRFRMQRQYGSGQGDSILVGNVDIHNIMDTNLARHSKVYSGRERMRAYGEARCGQYLTSMNYQIRRWPHRIN